MILLSTALCLLASQGYLRRERILSGEYHALLLWCATGLLLMLRSTELLMVFLALELLSLCLYSLAAYHRRLSISGEAAIKYFLMGAFVSAFVLYGIALVYGATGSTRFDAIGAALAGRAELPVLASLGFLLLVAGFGFKMSLVPFHAWSPDTYQGAPVAVRGLPLGGARRWRARWCSTGCSPRSAQGSGGRGVAKWSTVVAILSVLSMVVGNLLALVQRDIKRMLAYSGIAHMGYLLLALVTLDRASLTPVLVYLLAYALMNAGAFTVVTLLYSRPGEQHLISDLAGWGYRFPLLGGCLAVCMLSLGGIPPTARLPRQVRGLPEGGGRRPRRPRDHRRPDEPDRRLLLPARRLLPLHEARDAAAGRAADRRLGPYRGRGRRRSGPWRSASGPRVCSSG